MTGRDRLTVRWLGEQDYETVWRCMQTLTAARDNSSSDEIWLLSHPPVYTQGQAGRAEHLLNTGSIPVVQIDRGGQVTYHGPGQLVVYLLLDVRRAGLGVRALVSIMEEAIIALLAERGIQAQTREKAPGVYVGESKIASLGLRISRGCSYHGLALNLDMDLTPFAGINPCGYQGMPVTQLAALLPQSPQQEVVARDLLQVLISHLPHYHTIDEQYQLPGLHAETKPLQSIKEQA